MQQDNKHQLAQKVFNSTPLGCLIGTANEQAITSLDIVRSEEELQFIAKPEPGSRALELLEQLESELQAYFRGELRNFSLSLEPQGTPFQLEVWQALQSIPYGSSWTYKQLAEAVGRPKGYQAVGQANGRNPIVILIPCHRVLAANQCLGGYSSGLENKKKLLELEGIFWRENKINWHKNESENR